MPSVGLYLQLINSQTHLPGSKCQLHVVPIAFFSDERKRVYQTKKDVYEVNFLSTFTVFLNTPWKKDATFRLAFCITPVVNWFGEAEFDWAPDLWHAWCGIISREGGRTEVFIWDCEWDENYPTSHSGYEAQREFIMTCEARWSCNGLWFGGLANKVKTKCMELTGRFIGEVCNEGYLDRGRFQLMSWNAHNNKFLVEASSCQVVFRPDISKPTENLEPISEEVEAVERLSERPLFQVLIPDRIDLHLKHAKENGLPMRRPGPHPRDRDRRGAVQKRTPKSRVRWIN